MKPYKSVPVLKERIWGGQKLKKYNKSFAGTNIGESWETDKDNMPVLIKIIDANDILSVQVHPDDELAWQLEGQKYGKTEAWIVLDCEEDAELVAGIKKETTQGQLEEALRQGSVAQLLNIIKVKKGDCLYIPAGTVHSLGKGILVYEVQQPSDLTYRLYDWDRTDHMGNTRELHIEKAMKCINYDISELKAFNLHELNLQPQQPHVIFQSRYFTTAYLQLEKEQQHITHSKCFTAVTTISGSVWLSYENCMCKMHKGDTWIISEVCEIDFQADENSELIITEYLQSP